MAKNKKKNKNPKNTETTTTLTEPTPKPEPEPVLEEHPTPPKTFSQTKPFQTATRKILTPIKTTPLTLALTLIVGIILGIISTYIPPLLSNPVPENLDTISQSENTIKPTQAANMNINTGIITYNKNLQPQKTPDKNLKTLNITEDPACHYCYEFNQNNGKDIEQWVKQGNQLQIHLIPMLDRNQAPQVIQFPIILAVVTSLEPDKSYKLWENFYEMFPDDQKQNLRKWDIKEYRKLFDKTGITPDTQNQALWAAKSEEWQKQADKWLKNLTETSPDFKGTPYLLLNNKPINPDLYYIAPGAIKTYLQTGKVDPKYSIKKLQEQQKK